MYRLTFDNLVKEIAKRKEIHPTYAKATLECLFEILGESDIAFAKRMNAKKKKPGFTFWPSFPSVEFVIKQLLNRKQSPQETPDVR